MIIRLAQAADFPHVKEVVRKVNFLRGVDFIEATLPYWRGSSLYHLLVIEDNNKLVSILITNT